MTYVTPLERLYRQISTPSLPREPNAAAPVAAEPKKIELTRADVDSIIQRTRAASAAELEFILSNAAALRLTLGEKNQLSVDFTMQIAHARKGNGRRDDPNARFIAQTLGLFETPFGLVERSFVDGPLRDGARNIARCKRHQPPRCACWSSQRAILWQAQANGDKSPESWAAVRVYEALEDLELSSRAGARSGDRVEEGLCASQPRSCS